MQKTRVVRCATKLQKKSYPDEDLQLVSASVSAWFQKGQQAKKRLPNTDAEMCNDPAEKIPEEAYTSNLPSQTLQRGLRLQSAHCKVRHDL